MKKAPAAKDSDDEANIKITEDDGNFFNLYLIN